MTTTGEIKRAARALLRRLPGWRREPEDVRVQVQRQIQEDLRRPHPPPLDPVWPLPRRAEAYSNERIAREFARFDQVHYPFEFEGGARVDVKYAIETKLELTHDRAVRRFRHMMPWLLERAGGSLRGKTVLDIACNGGFWSIQCALLGAERVVGFDGRPELVAMADLVKDITGVTNAEFRVLDLSAMTPEVLGGTFDVVLFLGLLYHVPDPIAAMEQVRRMAGQFVLLDTNTSPSNSAVMAASWESRTDDVRNAIQPGIVWFPSRPCVELMARQAGFREAFHIPLLSSDLTVDYLSNLRNSWLLSV